MEYCYRLNLPQLPEVLREDALEILNQTRTESVSSRVYSRPTEIWKQEWLTISDYTFNQIFYFFRSNQTGKPHTDVIDPTLGVWGINWIFGGDSILDIWHTDDPSTYKSTVNEKMNAIWYDFNIPPEKSYKMEPGAYLVNVKNPHRAIGIGNRHCFSLRSWASSNVPWEEVVESFKAHII